MFLKRISGWWFGTMEFYDFPETVGNVIIPTDFHIFQRGSNHQPDFDGRWMFDDHISQVLTIKIRLCPYGGFLK